MSKTIKVEGGGKVPSKDKKKKSKNSRIIPKDHVIPKADPESINLTVAAMAGRKYKKRTRSQVISDNRPN